MEKIRFHEKWFYAHQSYEFASTPVEPFCEVTIPHDAMIHEERVKDLPGGRNTGYYPYASYEYKKKFRFQPEWEGKKLQFLFEGVYSASKVYINSMYAGSCMNGYIPFTIDADPFLRDGENEIRVVCRQYRDSRWYSGAGIYRDVWLLISDRVYIPEGKSSVVTKEITDREAVLEANVSVRNESPKTEDLELVLTICDEKEQPICRTVRTMTLFPGNEKNCRQRLIVEDPALWSTETPALYHLRAELRNRNSESREVRDTETTSFGIRTLSLSRNRGLMLNGETVLLRGTCIHHDNGIVGSCAYRESAFRKIRLLKEAGINAVRISHHPAGREILEACDRLGMLVMNEVSDVWTFCKNPHDYALFFENEWETTVARMVETSRNHPSVILYSLGNEIIECGNPKGAEFAWKLNEKIKSLDPDRFTILSLNVLLCMMDKRPEKNDQEEESRDVNEAMTKGQHVFKALITSPEVASFVEEAMGYVDIVGYNYGDSRYMIDKEEYPDRILCGSETFTEDLAMNWAAVKREPRIIGDFNWTGWDYIGETGVGKMEYEGEKDDFWRLAYCGDFDLIGTRRAQSWYRESVWGLAKHPWIAVQHPDHFGKEPERTPWSFFDGLACWDYPGWEGKETAVQVYADGDEVELLLDGMSLGRKAAGEDAGFVTEFSVPYHPGELTAVVYCKNQETGRWSLQSGIGKTSLVLIKEPDEPGFEGEELIRHYRIRNLYENGVLNSQEPVRVAIHVEDGTLLGFGSADPKGKDRFDGTECDLFFGEALVMIRSNGKERISLSRIAGGLSAKGKQ